MSDPEIGWGALPNAARIGILQEAVRQLHQKYVAALLGKQVVEQAPA
jgi:hypothetical protein